MKSTSVKVLVGRDRTPYIISSHLLEFSAYFRALLSERWMLLAREEDDRDSEEMLTVSIECEPDVFEHLLALLRYHSLRALPKLTDDEIFRLKKEADFYGIEVDDTPFSAPGDEVDDENDESKISSPTSDPTLLVKVTDNPGWDCELCGNNVWAVIFYLGYAFCVHCGNDAPKYKQFAHIMVAALRNSPVMDSHHDRMNAYLNGRPVFISDLGRSVVELNESIATYEETMLVTVTVPRCHCRCLASKPSWVVSLFHRHALCASCKRKLDHPRMLPLIFLAAARNAKHVPKLHMECYFRRGEKKTSPRPS
ncbi:hypothetical protein CBR_g39075 [Chara braunii]|uniref:BTB domain-containing protein n=1 Tax=Chara braunii TaxID=69332 RepID=A0A388LR05_CHABU|nr:hypothetical protein CBR_g39075 [Chara braunii]|eukprot:GBG84699.1 hypothetical protein CBR_g39075 [Chara braunii]